MKLHKIFFVFPLSFLLFSCVPAELDNIEGFVYSFPGLEEVEPLPDLIFTAPDEVIETDGEIIITKDADELVIDVVAAVIDDNITEENLVVIESFSEIAPEISSEEIIESVTDEWITGVLNGTIIPSDNLIQIAEEFKNNPEFVKYFSQLELPTIDGLVPGGRLYFPLSTEERLVVNEISRAFTLVGPCKESAEKIYLENVDQLEAQADSQLAETKTFYDDLRREFVVLYNQRLSEKDLIISASVDELNDFLIDFNQSVDALIYPEDVKRGLKIYIAAFTIELREQVVQWGIVFTDAAVSARDKRIEAANQEQASLEIEIRENLKDSIEKQTEAFEEAVNNCHNQGAGG